MLNIKWKVILMFISKKQLLTLLCFVSLNTISHTSPTQTCDAKAQAECDHGLNNINFDQRIKDAKTCGEKIIGFLKGINNFLPQITNGVQQANMETELKNEFMRLYGKQLTLRELLNIRNLTQNKDLGNGLIKLGATLFLEGLLMSSLSSLNCYKINLIKNPCKQCIAKEKEIKQLNEIIETYVKKIKILIENIKKRVKNILKTQLNLQEEFLESTNKEIEEICQYQNDDCINGIIDNFNVENIMQNLNVKEEEIKSFRKRIVGAFNKFLKNHLDTIKNLIPLFNKLKANTTVNTLIEFTAKFMPTKGSIQILTANVKAIFTINVPAAT